MSFVQYLSALEAKLAVVINYRIKPQHEQYMLCFDIAEQHQWKTLLELGQAYIILKQLKRARHEYHVAEQEVNEKRQHIPHKVEIAHLRTKWEMFESYMSVLFEEVQKECNKIPDHFLEHLNRTSTMLLKVPFTDTKLTIVEKWHIIQNTLCFTECAFKMDQE